MNKASKKTKIIKKNSFQQDFEKARNKLKGVVYWNARELQKIYGYNKWVKFEQLINKTIKSLIEEGEDVNDHILQVGKLIKKGKGAKQEIKDYKFSFNFCYELAMYGFKTKDAIKQARIYFRKKRKANENTQPKAQPTKAELLIDSFDRQTSIDANRKVGDKIKIILDLLKPVYEPKMPYPNLHNKFCMGYLTMSVIKFKRMKGIESGVLPDYLSGLPGKYYAIGKDLVDSCLENYIKDNYNRIKEYIEGDNSDEDKINFAKTIIKKEVYQKTEEIGEETREFILRKNIKPETHPILDKDTVKQIKKDNTLQLSKEPANTLQLTFKKNPTKLK